MELGWKGLPFVATKKRQGLPRSMSSVVWERIVAMGPSTFETTPLCVEMSITCNLSGSSKETNRPPTPPPKNSMETSRAKAKVETCHFNFGLSTTEPQKPTKLPCVGPPSRQRTRPWRRREASQTWKEGSWWQNLHHLIWEDYKSKGFRIKGYAGFLPPTVISWSYVFIFT